MVAEMRTLVVYYSRKGHVAQVALALAKELSADTDRIIDRKDRSGIMGWLGAGRDATRGISADIEEPERDPAGYDLVVVGTPIWNARPSTPVLAYLKKFSGRFASVAFFVVCGGRYRTPFEDLGALAGKAPAATMMVLDRELKKGGTATKVKEFAGKLRG